MRNNPLRTGAAVAKSIVCGAFYYSGGFHLLGWRHRSEARHISILMFHRVDDRPGDDPCSLPTLFVSRESFRKTIRFVSSHYTVISLADLLAALRGERPTPPNALLITFDDGYLDVFENAVPILREEGLPATVFLPTAFVRPSERLFWWDECYYLMLSAWRRRQLSAVASDDPELRQRIAELAGEQSATAASSRVVALVHALQSRSTGVQRELLDRMWDHLDLPREPLESGNRVADWTAVRRAVDDGISYGSHTRGHLFLDQESPDTVRDELQISRKELERQLGTPVRAFAYPGGKINPTVRQEVERAGYRCAFTTQRGVNGSDDSPFTLKRINIWSGTVSAPDGSFSAARLAFNLRRPALRHA